MSLRLSDRELKHLQALAKEEDKEKSSMARELLSDGFKFKMLVAYKEGHVTLSKLGRSLGMTLSQTLDFLSSFGIQAPIDYDDYLRGGETARRAVG
ncbi:hypothetical protein HY522_09155 [bacterium]|nr:hypothetical protein [bacterium]